MKSWQKCSDKRIYWVWFCSMCGVCLFCLTVCNGCCSVWFIFYLRQELCAHSAQDYYYICTWLIERVIAKYLRLQSRRTQHITLLWLFVTFLMESTLTLFNEKKMVTFLLLTAQWEMASPSAKASCVHAVAITYYCSTFGAKIAMSFVRNSCLWRHEMRKFETKM